jgi:hypothetical protein
VSVPDFLETPPMPQWPTAKRGDDARDIGSLRNLRDALNAAG